MQRNALVLFLVSIGLVFGACQGSPIVDSTAMVSGSDSDPLPPPPGAKASGDPTILPLPSSTVPTKEEVVPTPAPSDELAPAPTRVVDVRDARRVRAPVPQAPVRRGPVRVLRNGKWVVAPNGPQPGDVVEVIDPALGSSTGHTPGVVVDPRSPKVGEVVEVIDNGVSRPAGGRIVIDPNGPQVGDVVEVREDGANPMPQPLPGDGDANDLLDRVSGRAGVEADRRRFLVDTFVQNADEAIRQGDLSGARDYLERALQLDHSNARALNMLRSISTSRPDTVTDYMDDARRKADVRAQKAAIQVRHHVETGRNLETRKRYDAAIKEYRKALAVVSWYDETADFGVSVGTLTDLIESAQDKARVWERRRAQQALQDAQSVQEAEWESERMRRLGRIRAYFQAANTAFRQRDYGVAREYAHQVLREDPGNKDAEQLIQISHDAEHIVRDQKARREFDDQWKRLMKELENDSLPQVATVEFPDDWLENIAHRTPRDVGEPEDTAATAGIASIISVLENTRVNELAWVEASLDDVVKYVRVITGLNFVVTNRAREEQGEAVSATYTLDDVSVKTILDIVTSENGLKWVPENGIVKIALPDEVSGTMRLKFFDVKDLEVRIADFVGQEINLTPSNFTPPEPPELEEPEPLYPTDSLPDLIQQTIGGEGTWDEPASVEKTEGGILIVRNTSEVLGKVQNLLDQLRENTGILVNLEVRFLTVEDNFLRDVGVDVRGLGDNSQGIGAAGLGSNVTQDDVFFGIPAPGTNPEPSSVGRSNDAGIFYSDGQDGAYAGRVENLFDTLLGNEGVLTGSGGLSLQSTFLDDTQMEVILRAVEKSERLQQISAPRVTVYNTQRANVQVLNQVAYVADYEVEIAQASNIANPVVQTILDGIVLDVRPVVSADRRFVNLELRPTVAVLTRPIATFSTSLASGPIGANAPVILQLPELRVSRVRTTVNMPDRGTLLLGGLKFYEQEDFNSEVPLLSKLPILSFLLSRKGNYVNRRNLMVLITAEIVNLAELEPKDNLNVPELPVDADWTPVIAPEPCETEPACNVCPPQGGTSRGAFR